MKVCVVGAANIDLISYVPRLPRVGETLHGTQFRIGYGGKGANQAVMAAKLRAEVTMVCKLGRDVFGEGTLEVNGSSPGFEGGTITRRGNLDPHGGAALMDADDGAPTPVPDDCHCLVAR